jgi:hypothetical protein
LFAPANEILCEEKDDHNADKANGGEDACYCGCVLQKSVRSVSFVSERWIGISKKLWLKQTSHPIFISHKSRLGGLRLHWT